ncbi:hypothetical protein GOZ78_01900 [Agrobacterium vitis]|uniref:Uncharacterized protein n=1 Tax=Agrobacterium vitis TaxID=373 RepID=A0ABD6G9Q4_AGRVI|nr:hypothetical protein [Agrobacterium vitis]MUO77655.1 hypothetical protein [Agrobacterium vitis]MUO93172.1 hypothetical protein [Agrobacterium vitis]MUP04523.1 hypothetical protein [Agrobacterium vitis]MUZ81039.1 hypothetical protein [Agrobacterium vitis]MVA08775.1 hypothetical protein [Agrobacterium vitis]
MTPQEQDALIRENYTLKMALVRTFREIDPCTMIDTNTPIKELCDLPFTLRNQLRLLTLEVAR